jgi:glycerophosphoryl diester phosphodiesterase
MPITLCQDGRTVRLKWHKLRRHPDDPPFGRANLRAGLAAGASLEVDLRRLACGRMVCLHDALLEGETTGCGPVGGIDAGAIGELRMQGASEPPLLLDELVDTLRRGCAPETLIQLDLKATAAEIDEVSRGFLVAALEGVAAHFILSGCGWDAVTRLGGAVPGLALGYDPGDDLVPGGDVYALVRERAPRADTIYLHRGLVRAAQERGDPVVARLQAHGHKVDCWTIDCGMAEATADLRAALAAGCDQITTNSPAAWVADARESL